MHLAGKHITEEIFEATGLGHLSKGNMSDQFGFCRRKVWDELRKQFPEKMDASKLEGDKLKNEECPAKFLHNFQRRWREETGSAWDANKTTENFFKSMMKKALPLEVQKNLDATVGLMKMP